MRTSWLRGSFVVCLCAVTIGAVGLGSGTRGFAQEQTQVAGLSDPVASINITVDEAIASAEQALGGTASQVQVAFAVTVDGQHVFVDAADGRIMDIGPEAEQPSVSGFAVNDGKRHLASAAITPDQAVEAALGVAEGTVRYIELFWDDGQLVYEVTIGRTDVYIDAQTGTVIDIEPAFEVWR